MKNKGTFMGGVSTALMKENFRRQWYLPVLIFVLYFLSGIFPLLFLKGAAGEYAVVSLNNANFIYNSFITYIPIVVACVVMWYLHKPEKAFAMHAQPYSRGKLFNTHILMGWIMMVIPVILVGIIYMGFSGSLTVTDMVTNTPEQAFTPKDAVIWMLNSISLYTFCYGIAVLAGSIVGNTVTQVLGTLVFYNLVPALIGTEMLYSGICLPGYEEPSQTTMEILLNSDPMLGGILSFLVVGISGDIHAEGLGYHMIAHGWYFLFGLILIAIAKYAVYKGKLEKVGDSMIFRTVESIVTVVITFIGGALLGAFFGLLNDNAVFIFLGAILGACLSFFLVKLILERSVRIFNGRNLKILAVSVVILLIWLAAFVFDLTGYAKRVPDMNDIKTVDAAKVLSIAEEGYATDQEEIYFNDSNETEDESFINKVTELHKYVTENKLYIYDEESGKTETCNLKFVYALKNGKTMSRTFTIAPDDKAKEMISGILNDEVIKEGRKIPEEFKQVIKKADISQDIYKADGYTNKYATVSGAGSKEEIIRFIDAYNKDKEQEKLGLGTVVHVNYVDSADGYVEEPEEVQYSDYLEITIYYDNKDVEPRYEGYEPFVSIRVAQTDKNSREVLGELMDKYLVNEEEIKN